MSSKTSIQISVRDLVEYVHRQGDISFGYFGQSRMVEGTKAHQTVQKSRGKDYQKEVYISENIDRKKTNLNLRGRIDGVFERNGIKVIEEIKSTSRNLAKLTDESHSSYWAQAKIYAYLYALQNNIKKLEVQLTYYQIDLKKTRTFQKELSIKELEEYCFDIIDQYLDWAVNLSEWLRVRKKSILNISFPFPSYRDGQEKMIKITGEVLKNNNKLFCQAPTGIGKTIAVMYPAIKNMGTNFDSKIFYLTAKTTTKLIAEETLSILRKNGLKLKSTTITAKAKTCFKEQVLCDPNYCEYARGHFDRINGAMKDIFKEEAFTHKVIEKYAKKHTVCPFEFSLDLTNLSDCIICDYNYVFDPRVYLKRYFSDEKGDFTLLIDEAHNLVDRARTMFSADLQKKSMLKLSRSTKEEIPELSKILNQLNRYMIRKRKECEQFEYRHFTQNKLPEEEFFKLLRRFSSKSLEWLEKNQPSEFREDLVEFYFDVRSFLRVADDYDKHYVTYFRKYGNNVKVKLFCLDPSYLLKDALNRGKTSVFFSATLTPLDYFAQLLGGDGNSTKFTLPSPFPKKNLLLMLSDSISTRYIDRESTYKEIARLIHNVSSGKIGNYLTYFPSYEYMNRILEEYRKMDETSIIIVQEQGMTEQERKEFLDKFSTFGKKTLVGFAVMGGIFGEGIDLIGEKLSGAIVVGVGIPKLSLERDLIKTHFDIINRRGFLFAYTFPGMNKVLQAVGRVIRTEKDRGVVLLIGERYSTRTYEQLFPESWTMMKRIFSQHDVKNRIEEFWKEKIVS